MGGAKGEHEAHVWLVLGEQGVYAGKQLVDKRLLVLGPGHVARMEEKGVTAILLVNRRPQRHQLVQRKLRQALALVAHGTQGTIVLGHASPSFSSHHDR